MREIMKEYQEKRDRNQDLLDSRIKEVYSNFPDIKNISDEIRQNGLKMTKAILNKVSKEELANLGKRQDYLLEEKKNLLDKHNIKPSFLELQYDCKVCKDTGFLENGKKCNCLKQRILENTYAMSNMKEILEKDNFDTFDINIFSDKILENRNTSPREHMKQFLQDMYLYASNFEDDSDEKRNNLIFMGTPGLGKTFMCSCIAKELLDNGYTVIYLTAFKLMEIIEKYKFKTGNFSDLDEENYNNIFDCDLLIIDDLGTEMPNTFTTSELFNIINQRLNSKKRIIISTNLGLMQIKKIYTERILSRIVGNFRLCEFYGEDLRF